MGGGYCLTRFTQYNYCLTRDTVTNGRILLFNTGFTNQWEEFTVWRGCNDWWEGFTVGIQTNGWGLLFEMEYRDRLEGKITNKKMYWVPQSCHLWGVLQKQNPCSRQSTYKHTWIKSVNTIMHNIHTCWTAQHTHLLDSTTYTPVRQHNIHTCQTAQHAHLLDSTTYTPVRQHNIHTCWTAEHTHLSDSTKCTPVEQHNICTQWTAQHTPVW